MSFNIDEWLNLAVKKLQRAFGKNLLFVGLQGSYNRGEATLNSDIDLVVILNNLTFADLKLYRSIIESMPQKDKACGFISGKKEIKKWSKTDLFFLFL
ncbi:nucleotidyltransferase domain-containing protein [bacterium]|nr:nucleotidyltransferase domain-containing protein [bacterium]